MKRNCKPHMLLVGMYNGVAAMENSLTGPQTFKHRVTI